MALLLFVLLLAIGGVFFWLLNYTSSTYQQEVMQKLNQGLAGHLVESDALLAGGKVNQPALEHLFHQLMIVNPSIEVYLLDRQGRILAFSAPEGRVKRQHVSLQPIKRFIEGRVNYPLLGDDPRSPRGSKVFSASPISSNGEFQGYLYVILGGEAFDSIAQRIAESYALRVALWLLLGALFVSLVFGLVGFSLITRRLALLAQVIQSVSPQDKVEHTVRYIQSTKRNDEIESLGRSFNQMADRIDQQVAELKRNDAQRREMIANISHDLRTPLTSLHGYIETLLLKDSKLNDDQRRQYLTIANTQSNQLIRLVSELFELAKLDSCETILDVEAFSLAELVQDVVNKFKLKARERDVHLIMDCQPQLPFAYGDIGLIQRVLDNLIENALQHTQRGGEVKVSLNTAGKHISVEISDTGSGIPQEELPYIFERFYRLDKSRKTSAQHAGLGLAIAKRILELHKSRIWAQSQPDRGTTFGFQVSLVAG
jgi:signal transduction histidine kinase